MRGKLVRHKIVAAVCGLSILLILAGTLWSVLALKNSPSILIHHYRENINQYGTISNLLEIGILGFFAVLIDSYLALLLEERDWFLGKLLAASGLFFSILLFIGFAAIISVN